ncbi:MAG: HAD-IC family P-type ATPase [Acidimicrobiia bacterium]
MDHSEVADPARPGDGPGSSAPDPDTGLTSAQVAERVAAGLVNDTFERTSRTVGEIMRANILTRFNAILGTMLVIILIVGSYRDALFGVVLVTNALIGIIQEVRAKRTLDRLAVLNAPKARIVRDASVAEHPTEDIVLDDVLDIRVGDQVVADGSVLATDGLEIDESLLTGESDPVHKTPGDEALSGSIVVAGEGRLRATRIGAEAYARKLADEAKRFALVRSELQDGINLILRYVTWAIVPTAALLLLSQLNSHESVKEALAGTVAGVVGMVPEGLVLLTSIAFALSVIVLGRRNVLVQELPAVEGLARVDVICVDKTGTLTEGIIAFERVDVFDGVDADIVTSALGALGEEPDANPTLAAIADEFDAPHGWEVAERVPFSSARKWSATDYGPHGTWILGAPEMVLAGRGDDAARRRADGAAGGGSRVLLLARTGNSLREEQLPDGLEPAALVLLREQVRPDAADTIRYFGEQGVAVKVISGDNSRTVGAVASRVAVPHADRVVDARSLDDDDPDGLADTLDHNAVFGRVTPHQKRSMVGALQSRGHVVAMTGDGVNDALALKDADIGIAMGSGAPATRAVAQLVLMDGRFATMPGVVAEGRRVIGNIERVANLFVTKTVYVMILSILVGVFLWPFPFLPRHLTIVSSLTIGIPGFFLAMAPNTRRYQPGFVPRVLRFAVPAGIIASAATFGSYALARANDLSLTESRTTATLTLLVIGLWILMLLARPFTLLRTLLVVGMVALVVGAFTVPLAKDFFDLELPAGPALVESLLVAAAGAAVLEVFWRLTRNRWGLGGGETRPHESTATADAQPPTPT